MMLHMEAAKRGQRGTLLRQMSEEKAERHQVERSRRHMNKGKPGFSETEHGDKLRLMSNERPALFIAMSVYSLPGSSTSTSLRLSKILFQKVPTSCS